MYIENFAREENEIEVYSNSDLDLWMERSVKLRQLLPLIETLCLLLQKGLNVIVAKGAIMQQCVVVEVIVV